MEREKNLSVFVVVQAYRIIGQISNNLHVRQRITYKTALIRLNTRKLSYRKDDRAMRAALYNGCRESFRESLAMPSATFPKI